MRNVDGDDGDDDGDGGGGEADDLAEDGPTGVGDREYAAGDGAAAINGCGEYGPSDCDAGAPPTPGGRPAPHPGRPRCSTGEGGSR